MNRTAPEQEHTMKQNSTTSIPGMLGMALAGCMLAACAGGLAGCRGDRDDKPPRQFFPDMDDMPRWKPQAESDFFPDHRTMRQPVAHAVAFSRTPMSGSTLESRPEWSKPFMDQRDDLMKDNDAFYLGKNADGSFVHDIPTDVTKDLLALGQTKFNISCAVCHGYEGDGLGIVGDTTKNRPFSWSYALPNWHDQKYKMQDPADPKSQKHTDGFFFDTARNGVRDPNGGVKMPGYAHALNERETWAIVSYIRALQRSRLGTAGELSEAARRAADATAASQPAPTSAPATTAPAGGKP